jgi:hypothetical protein
VIPTVYVYGLGDQTPDRVVEHEWGLTLVWDVEGGQRRVHYPWHRIESWVELPPSKDPSQSF